MLKPVKYDDSKTMVWYDFNVTTLEELDSCELDSFDVFNIPFSCYDKEVKNFHITFFSSKKSSTGYCAIFLKKRDKQEK